MPETSTTIFFATLGVLALGARYYFRNYASASTSSIGDSTSATQTAPGSQTPSPRREITEDMVSVVQVIVPKMSRDEIREDLNITHSVEATTERLLEKSKKKNGNTLFDRYGVDTNASTTDSSSSAVEEDANWVNIREKRELKLRKQREEMLLKARQRALELRGKPSST